MLGGGVLRQARDERPSGESFRLVLSSAVKAEDLDRWFRSAAAGARERYAEGPFVPQGADGVRLARKLANEGRAELHVEADPADPRRRLYIIEKLESPARSIARAVDPAELKRLIKLLSKHAERHRRAQVAAGGSADGGFPCPSNNVLARELGLPRGEQGRKRVVYLMKVAGERGRIAVENRGTMQPRVVTILAAGRAQGKATKA